MSKTEYTREALMNLKSLLKRYTVDQLKEAIRLRSTYGRVEALEEKKAALLKQVAKIDRQLSKLNGNGAATTASRPGRSGRRKGYKMSAATREKMRQAALRRYGKLKDEAPATGKRKRKPFSAETRAKMRASQKARWAKVREGKTEPTKSAAE